MAFSQRKWYISDRRQDCYAMNIKKKETKIIKKFTSKIEREAKTVSNSNKSEMKKFPK